MAIESIQRISMATPSSAITSSMTASKTLQSQLQMKQQSLKKLSNDASLSAEEKAEQERAYKAEIEILERKLEQLRQKQKEEKAAEKVEENTKVEKSESKKDATEKTTNETSVEQDQQEEIKVSELSLDEVKEILDSNFTLKETMIEQGVAYDKENYVRRLTAEIKQDQLLNVDTSSKEAELEKLQTQENHWQNAKAKQAASEPTPFIHPDVQVSIN